MYQGSLNYSGDDRFTSPIAKQSSYLTDDEITATFRLLAAVKHWMDTEFAPTGYNVGWNCGATGGQTLFHAHMHVIPRFPAELLAGQGIRAHLKVRRQPLVSANGSTLRRTRREKAAAEH